MINDLGRGRPNLKDYGKCLDNMRKLLIEYQKCPNPQRKYEIETELIRFD
jgi:hypothetical protein